MSGGATIERLRPARRIAEEDLVRSRYMRPYSEKRKDEYCAHRTADLC